MRISDWSSDVCSSDLAQPAQKISRREAGKGTGQQRQRHGREERPVEIAAPQSRRARRHPRFPVSPVPGLPPAGAARLYGIVVCRRPPLTPDRSEEHTSELQSLMRISYAVFCLKKKTDPYIPLPHSYPLHTQ